MGFSLSAFCLLFNNTTPETFSGVVLIDSFDRNGLFLYFVECEADTFKAPAGAFVPVVDLPYLQVVISQSSSPLDHCRDNLPPDPLTSEGRITNHNGHIISIFSNQLPADRRSTGLPSCRGDPWPGSAGCLQAAFQASASGQLTSRHRLLRQIPCGLSTL